MRAAVAPLVLAALAGCGGVDPDEALSGGDTTVFDASRNAFGLSARNISFERRQRFLVGNSLFTDPWVTAPSSVMTRDGLGPVFNASACAGCHVRDGRGQPPAAGEEMLSMLARISLPGVDAHGGPLAVPGYGGQLQPRSIAGVPAEVRTEVRWDEIEGAYADGTPYLLRRPILDVVETAFGPLPSETQFSLRAAPVVFGLGLLQCVPEEDLLANADEGDADGDGVSGRPNRVWDAVRGRVALGRFGWKANQPTLTQQNQGAFLGDIGITGPLFPEPNCAEGQTDCASAPSGGAPELTGEIAELVDVYVTLLAPPARRDIADPQVVLGRALFAQAGCESCHVASLRTGECPGAGELAHQRIRPYTDLLLHDLGEGLADHRPDFEAGGTEWRTPPLWGVGLIERVNDHLYLLHDGRARGFEEAILWHGGEAETARERFRAMPSADRAALVRFLQSL